jgi:hypothetical protein
MQELSGEYLKFNTSPTADAGVRIQDAIEEKDKYYKKLGSNFRFNQTKTFDTGGYTGEWGPEGRLAFLH